MVSHLGKFRRLPDRLPETEPADIWTEPSFVRNLFPSLSQTVLTPLEDRSR